MTIVERRFAQLDDVEVRQDEDSPVQFRGHAAVFGEATEIGGMFREVVDKRAFNKTLKDGADVRFLYNHEPDSVMARTKTGSLRLSVDERGLVTDADLPRDDWDVQRLLPKLQRGDVDQMSFAFRAIKDKWEENPEDGGLPIRTLTEVALFDVSPVTFPAYEGTDAEAVSVRALLQGRPEVAEMLNRTTTGHPERYVSRKVEVEERPETLETPETPEVEPAQEPPAPREPSRDEHSLYERQQALMRQVLDKIQRDLERK